MKDEDVPEFDVHQIETADFFPSSFAYNDNIIATQSGIPFFSQSEENTQIQNTPFLVITESNSNLALNTKASEESSSNGSSLSDLKKLLQDLPTPNQITHLTEHHRLSLNRNVHDLGWNVIPRIEEAEEKEEEKESTSATNYQKISSSARERRRARHTREKTPTTENLTMLISSPKGIDAITVESRATENTQDPKCPFSYRPEYRNRESIENEVSQISKSFNEIGNHSVNSMPPFVPLSARDPRENVTTSLETLNSIFTSRCFDIDNKIPPLKCGGYRPISGVIIRNLSSDSESDINQENETSIRRANSSSTISMDSVASKTALPALSARSKNEKSPNKLCLPPLSAKEVEKSPSRKLYRNTDYFETEFSDLFKKNVSESGITKFPEYVNKNLAESSTAKLTEIVSKHVSNPINKRFSASLRSFEHVQSSRTTLDPINHAKRLLSAPIISRTDLTENVARDQPSEQIGVIDLKFREQEEEIKTERRACVSSRSSQEYSGSLSASKDNDTPKPLRASGSRIFVSLPTTPQKRPPVNIKKKNKNLQSPEKKQARKDSTGCKSRSGSSSVINSARSVKSKMDFTTPVTEGTGKTHTIPCKRDRSISSPNLGTKFEKKNREKSPNVDNVYRVDFVNSTVDFNNPPKTFDNPCFLNRTSESKLRTKSSRNLRSSDSTAKQIFTAKSEPRNYVYDMLDEKNQILDESNTDEINTDQVNALEITVQDVDLSDTDTDWCLVSIKKFDDGNSIVTPANVKSPASFTCEHSRGAELSENNPNLIDQEVKSLTGYCIIKNTATASDLSLNSLDISYAPSRHSSRDQKYSEQPLDANVLIKALSKVSLKQETSRSQKDCDSARAMPDTHSSEDSKAIDTWRTRSSENILEPNESWSTPKSSETTPSRKPSDRSCISFRRSRIPIMITNSRNKVSPYLNKITEHADIICQNTDSMKSAGQLYPHVPLLTELSRSVSNRSSPNISGRRQENKRGQNTNRSQESFFHRSKRCSKEKVDEYNQDFLNKTNRTLESQSEKNQISDDEAFHSNRTYIRSKSSYHSQYQTTDSEDISRHETYGKIDDLLAQTRLNQSNFPELYYDTFHSEHHLPSEHNFKLEAFEENITAVKDDEILKDDEETSKWTPKSQTIKDIPEDIEVELDPNNYHIENVEEDIGDSYRGAPPKRFKRSHSSGMHEISTELSTSCNKSIIINPEKLIADTIRRNIDLNSGRRDMSSRDNSVHSQTVSTPNKISPTSKLNCMQVSLKESPRLRRKSQERFPFTISESIGAVPAQSKFTGDHDQNALFDDETKSSDINYKLNIHPSIIRLATSGFEDTPNEIISCVNYEHEKHERSGLFMPKMKKFVDKFSLRRKKTRKTPEKVKGSQSSTKIIYENQKCRNDSLIAVRSESSSMQDIANLNLPCSSKWNVQDSPDKKSSPVSIGNAVKSKESQEYVLSNRRQYDRDDLWVKDLDGDNQRPKARTTPETHSGKSEDRKDRYDVFLARSENQLENFEESFRQATVLQSERHLDRKENEIVTLDDSEVTSPEKNVPKGKTKQRQQKTRQSGCMCLRFFRIVGHALVTTKYQSPINQPPPLRRRHRNLVQ